ncbi:MAG TPA: hypothetical protein DCS93_03970 [Microscillaceae bacterium]|nr:hypothetical protein [Microscillaceae bacterium]
MESDLPIHNREEIIEGLQSNYQKVLKFIEPLEEPHLKYKPAPEVWSIAENLQHLILSSNPVATSLAIPSMVLWVFGLPKPRPSRKYEQLVSDYLQALTQGFQSPPEYVPYVGKNKEGLLEAWQRMETKLVRRLNNLWREEQLDKYLVPHPSLGKITIRELLFFTVYHAEHHLKNMQERLQEAQLSYKN